MADVYALCRGVVKSIQGKKLKFNHCQRELLARTFAHFLDNLESALRKEHTKDDCLRMCAKALSELWRVMTYAEAMVAEWADEEWWRTAMCSSVSGCLQMHMNLLLQDFIRCLDVARIAIAEATRDQTFKLPIMDHSQFFAAIVDEAHKRDREALVRDIEAVKERKSKKRNFLQRKFGSSYGLSKYLVRKLHSDAASAGKHRHCFVDSHYVEPTETSLGDGSVGTVFECKCFGMPAVAKCLSVKALGGDEGIKTLAEEVEALAALQHVNLVQFIGYTVHENRHMLISERGDENLQSYLTRSGPKPLSHLKAFDILQQIAEAMKYLHEHEVMHGDLKASNVVLDTTERAKDGFWWVHVKLADYGLCRLKQRMRPSSATYSNPMSWMAPEVYDFKAGAEMYTKATDVYSFAMIMYEMLTGAKPFETLSPRDVLPNVRAGWRPVVRPGGAAYVLAYMQRCWAPNPLERPLFADICSMLSYCKGVMLRHSFPSPLSCINEYDAEVLTSQLGAKWCIHEGARKNLPVEVYSFATFDVTCRSSSPDPRKFSGVDEVEEVMQAGRHFGNWASQACDLQKSFALFKCVSHTLNPEALWRLGSCYEIGMGVAVSELKAIALYEQARDLGFPSAHVDIGHCHAAGHGVARSFEHAERSWTAALLLQTKAGVPLLGIQELLQKLSLGTSGCTTLDAESVRKAMASRLQQLLQHEIGRLLVAGPNSCNASLLQKISSLQAAPSVGPPTHADTEKRDPSIVKHVVGNPEPSPSPSPSPSPPPPPHHQHPQPHEQQQQQRRPRIVLLKGSGQVLKRRASRNSASSATLVIIAALLILIAAILMKYFQDMRRMSQLADSPSHAGSCGIHPAPL